MGGFADPIGGPADGMDASAGAMGDTAGAMVGFADCVHGSAHTLACSADILLLGIRRPSLCRLRVLSSSIRSRSDPADRVGTSISDIIVISL